MRGLILSMGMYINELFIKTTNVRTTNVIFFPAHVLYITYPLSDIIHVHVG